MIYTFNLGRETIDADTIRHGWAAHISGNIDDVVEIGGEYPGYYQKLGSEALDAVRNVGQSIQIVKGESLYIWQWVVKGDYDGIPMNFNSAIFTHSRTP